MMNEEDIYLWSYIISQLMYIFIVARNCLVYQMRYVLDTLNKIHMQVISIYAL